MQQIEQHNEYIITFGNQTPDQAGPDYFTSSDYDYAKAEAYKLAYQLGLDPDEIRIFYRIAITVNTNWVEVGNDTNYEEAIQQIYDEFKPL